MLAKLRGFPPWPAVVAPDIEPEPELDPNSNEQNNDDQEDSPSSRRGSRTNTRRTITVKFLQDDTHTQLPIQQVSPLDSKTCQAWLDSAQARRTKKKSLIEAYRMVVEGFDVQEFLVFGSRHQKATDDPEYANSDDDDAKPTRRSARQAAKIPRTRTGPRTRRSKQGVNSEANSEDCDDSQEAEGRDKLAGHDEDTREESREPAPPPAKKTKRQSTKKEVDSVPQTPRYNYDDDEDWTIVGLGPQDLTIQRDKSKIISKLSSKKNIEQHNESRLEVEDRIASINKTILEVLFGEQGPKKADLEFIIMEYENAMGLGKSPAEFLTLFQNNDEFLHNLRALFNMVGYKLKEWEIWIPLQELFSETFGQQYIPDSHTWHRVEDATELE